MSDFRYEFGHLIYLPREALIKSSNMSQIVIDVLEPILRVSPLEIGPNLLLLIPEYTIIDPEAES